MNIIKNVQQNSEHKDKPITTVPDLEQAHEQCVGVKIV